jgi:histidine triad (HIT) family protein
MCLFCRIVAGELPAEVIHRDDLVMAIADIHPIRAGHSQIISRQHVPCFEDLPEATASRIIHVG